MHFFYADESGCTGADLASEQQPVFVLGGISVSDEKWGKTTAAFAALIAEYFAGAVPSGFELHAADLLSPAGQGHFDGHDREARNQLALRLLGLLEQRGHQIHYIALDKRRLATAGGAGNVPEPGYDPLFPYLLGYDYMINTVEWIIRNRFGRTGAGMIILDHKAEVASHVDRITHMRRFEGPVARRTRRIVEFTHPVDSARHPMIQLSDLVVFCTRRFLEIELGYRSTLPPAAREFFGRCYGAISSRLYRAGPVERDGREFQALNSLLKAALASPRTRWRAHYDLGKGEATVGEPVAA